jgi:hypothetical protein
MRIRLVIYTFIVAAAFDAVAFDYRYFQATMGAVQLGGQQVRGSVDYWVSKLLGK